VKTKIGQGFSSLNYELRIFRNKKEVKILQKENQDNSIRFVEIISSISQNPRWANATS